MIKKGLLVCVLALMLPYISTLSWTGRVTEVRGVENYESGKKILIERGKQVRYMDVEEYLPGVVAKQMPADYGQEALRAQAIIARTYIYKRMGDADEIEESQLNMEYLEEQQMQKLWGSDYFVSYYHNVETAVKTSGGMVMMADGSYIDPLFHRASTGRTRNGDENHPYLQSVDSKWDLEAEEFISMKSWSKEEFAEKINSIGDAEVSDPEQIVSSIQMIEREEGGYVKKIQIGTKTYQGEEIQYALGLNSPSFTLEEFDGKIRAVCEGIGHGYGMSQYGAKKMDEEGWKAEDILSYFYKNITLNSE